LLLGKFLGSGGVLTAVVVDEPPTVVDELPPVVGDAAPVVGDGAVDGDVVGAEPLLLDPQPPSASAGRVRAAVTSTTRERLDTIKQTSDDDG
jgi:hypothetical protein